MPQFFRATHELASRRACCRGLNGLPGPRTGAAGCKDGWTDAAGCLAGRANAARLAVAHSYLHGGRALSNPDNHNTKYTTQKQFCTSTVTKITVHKSKSSKKKDDKKYEKVEEEKENSTQQQPCTSPCAAARTQ